MCNNLESNITEKLRDEPGRNDTKKAEPKELGVRG